MQPVQPVRTEIQYVHNHLVSSVICLMDLYFPPVRLILQRFSRVTCLLSNSNQITFRNVSKRVLESLMNHLADAFCCFVHAKDTSLGSAELVHQGCQTHLLRHGMIWVPNTHVMSLGSVRGTEWKRRGGPGLLSCSLKSQENERVKNRVFNGLAYYSKVYIHP